MRQAVSFKVPRTNTINYVDSRENTSSIRVSVCSIKSTVTSSFRVLRLDALI